MNSEQTERKVPFRLFNYPLLNNQLIHPLQPPQYPLPQIHNIRKPFQLQQRLFQIHPQQGHPLKFIEERTEGCKKKELLSPALIAAPGQECPISLLSSSATQKRKDLLFLWMPLLSITVGVFVVQPTEILIPCQRCDCCQ